MLLLGRVKILVGGINMRVGTKVKLKVACLGNDPGTIGVVFYDYGDGFQAIFSNGSYDGFSLVHKMPNGQIEADFILEKVGFVEQLSGYEFKNVLTVEDDFRKGLWGEVFKMEGK